MSSTASHHSFSLNRVTQAAMAGAGFMVAHQIAGKAARDGLFLAQYAPTDLPKMVAVAAGFALLLGFAFSRYLDRHGPLRLVPAAFLLSSGLHLAEWWLYGFAPGAAAIAVYLHMVGLGAVLMSGFWSMASELYDPREAKARFGRIAGAGTAGGIAGGLAAERVAAWLSPPAILLLLTLLHMVCCGVLWSIRPPAPARKPVKMRQGGSAREAFERAPFLWSLAALVLLGTTSAALLDYLFKSSAAAEFGRGPALVRSFAFFYTGCQVMTFLVQVTLSRLSLEKLGLGRTVSSLPVAVGLGSGLSLLVPWVGMNALARAFEMILRGSLFRAGYELFYTPIPASDKRSVKTIIDVGCDRLGDAVGAGIVQAVILLGPALVRPEILGITILLSVATTWIASRMDRAYLGVLEKGLVNRAVELDLADVEDSTTLTAVRKAAKVVPVKPPEKPRRPVTATGVDPVVVRLAELRSADPARARAALASPERLDPALVAQTIRLLAWDEVADAARQALYRSAPSIVGQLVDVLADPQTDFAVRRRIPRILSHAPTQRAVDGLIEGLADLRFEVRFQCGRGLDYLRQRSPGLRYDPAVFFALTSRELSVSRSIWESHRLLDHRQSATESADDFSFLDEVLHERANQSLEHVFSLLAVVLPREPLKIAFRALHTDDRLLRGLALEYLDGVLPPDLKEKLWPVIEAPPPAPASRPEEVLQRLMESNQSLVLQIQNMTKAAGAPPVGG